VSRTQLLKSYIITSLLFTIVLIVGIQSVPEDKAITSTRNFVDVIFQADKRETNTTTKDMSFFLPVGMEIESELEFNTVLEKNDQLFILFYNPHEKNYSKTLYKTAKKRQHIYSLLYSFRDDEKFGYLHVMPLEDEHYEIVLSVGDIKMTTLTSTEKMTSSVREMAEIIHSVTFN
jgi:hypothetical protein